jgi:hypothetical protein
MHHLGKKKNVEEGKARKKHVHTHVFEIHTFSQYITFTINDINLELSKSLNNNLAQAIIRKLVKISRLILGTTLALARISPPIYVLTGKRTRK